MVDVSGVIKLESLVVAANHKTTIRAEKLKGPRDGEGNQTENDVAFVVFTIGDEKSVKERRISKASLALQIPIVMITTAAMHAINFLRFLVIGVLTLDKKIVVLSLKELAGFFVDTVTVPVLGIISIFSKEKGLKACHKVKNLFGALDYKPTLFTRNQTIINLAFQFIFSPVNYLVEGIDTFSFSAVALDKSFVKPALRSIGSGLIGPIAFVIDNIRLGVLKGHSATIVYDTDDDAPVANKSPAIVLNLFDDEEEDSESDESVSSSRDSSTRVPQNDIINPSESESVEE